uniref:Tumor necrosis factor receptor superfamily member 5 n=1 Tax=Otus sunia TaxID=257818 RepID=A0A8C8AC70_9STRI
MKRLEVLGLLGAVLLGCWEPSGAARCSEKQYEHKGGCCNRCQPGEKLVSECNGTENSVCTRCESGHYQQSWTRERHCTPHDICEENAGLIVKTQGNATHNTACQCQAGTHCSDSSCQTCVENQPCQRGFGFVAAKAMARMSSPCEPCAEGTFSNVSSKTEPCHPWTRVGRALLAVGADPHHGRGRHLPRGHLHLLPGPHRSQAAGEEAGGGRGASGAPGGPSAHGDRGWSLPCAGDPARGPARGPGGRQGEPNLGAGAAVRARGLGHQPLCPSPAGGTSSVAPVCG